MERNIHNKNRDLSLAILIAVSFVGCEQGACYYSCTEHAETVSLKCKVQVSDAESCTILAEDSCYLQEDLEIGRIEWTKVSDVYCDECDEAACAPEWWTRAKIVLEKKGDGSTDGDYDSGV